MTEDRGSGRAPVASAETGGSNGSLRGGALGLCAAILPPPLVQGSAPELVGALLCAQHSPRDDTCGRRAVRNKARCRGASARRLSLQLDRLDD